MNRVFAPIRGFALIELLAVLAILGILYLKGLPAFEEIMTNAKIREAAEGLQSGLTLARGESVRRNQQVAYDLVTNLSSGCASSSQGAAWVVRLQAGVASDGKCDVAVDTQSFVSSDATVPLIMGKGSIGVNGSVSVSASSFQSDGVTAYQPTGLCFDNFGRMACVPSTKPVRFLISPSATSKFSCGSTVSNPARCLQVCVMGGVVKMCDPSLPYDPANLLSNDPRACSADPRYSVSTSDNC